MHFICILPDSVCCLGSAGFGGQCGPPVPSPATNAASGGVLPKVNPGFQTVLLMLPFTSGLEFDSSFKSTIELSCEPIAFNSSRKNRPENNKKRRCKPSVTLLHPKRRATHRLRGIYFWVVLTVVVLTTGLGTYGALSSL